MLEKIRNSRQKGVLMVEFVIVFPLFLLLLWLIIYFGMVFHDYNTVNQLAREGARYGVVGNTDAAVTTAVVDKGQLTLTSLYAVQAGDVKITRATDNTLNDEKYLEIEIVAQRTNQGNEGIVESFLPNKLPAKVRMRVELEPGETP